jgi:hypothetical protein
MPSKAAIDAWAVDALGLPFNDPTPGSNEYEVPKPVADPTPAAAPPTPPAEDKKGRRG